jgi:hypothetical protein
MGRRVRVQPRFALIVDDDPGEVRLRNTDFVAMLVDRIPAAAVSQDWAAALHRRGREHGRADADRPDAGDHEQRRENRSADQFVTEEGGKPSRRRTPLPSVHDHHHGHLRGHQQWDGRYEQGRQVPNRRALNRHRDQNAGAGQAAECRGKREPRDGLVDHCPRFQSGLHPLPSLYRSRKPI